MPVYEPTATPRTEANLIRFELSSGPNRIPIDGEWCRADFARQLESEVVALSTLIKSQAAEIERLKEDLRFYGIKET
jgi:hypothetical protein